MLTTIYKKIEICCSHTLHLPYESKCNNLHGHNYVIEVWISGEPNPEGMVFDYARISEVIKNFDHKNLNDFMKQPTAENFAALLRDAIIGKMHGKLTSLKVRVSETSSSWAEVSG